jgi:outer membrane protein assembly factor BamA
VISFQGQSQKLYSLKIKSSKEIDAKIIKPYLDLKEDSVSILYKLNELKTAFQNHAYWAVSIDSVQFDSVNVYINFYQGPKYSIGTIDVSVIEPWVLDEINYNRKLKSELVLSEIQKIEKSILSVYENNGYPFAKVFLDFVEIHDSVFEAKIFAIKGPYYKMDSLIVKGDVKISSNYIEKVIQIKPDQEFNQGAISNIKKQIDNLRFLSEIKPAEIEFKKDAIDLYLYLEKKKANRFNGIIGFLPENEETGKLLITGELKLNLVNSFGRGEEIILDWEKLESSTQKLNIGFSYPYIFKSNLGVDFGFGLYKKDSIYLSLNADLGLRLFLGGLDYAKIYYRYKSSSKIGNDINGVSNNYADVNSNIIGGAYYLNRIDYLQNPRKGIEINIFGGVGFKNLGNSQKLSDSLNIELDDRTIELESGLDLNIYFPIYNNFVFHFRNVSRYMNQFSDKDPVYFENELYRFGGAKTLRGFDESIFFASIYSIQNIEIKYLFEKNSAFYVFWNGAYYYQDITQNITEDFPWGFGIGLDFDTKAGIFSLSYALGKQFDNPFEIQSAKIHFGYISRF